MTKLPPLTIVYYTDITNPLTTRLTNLSIASARKNVPGVIIKMLTPDWHVLSPDIDRVDLWRVIHNLPTETHYDFRRCRANATITEPALFIDTDTIIQKDVSDVFEYSFDVAPTKRHKPIDAQIPYNMGVCFSRTPQFWNLVAFTIPRHTSSWYDVEKSFSRVALMTNEFTIKVLSGSYYNRTPESTREDISEAAIVHYKGNRKNIMLAREKEFGL